MVDCVCQVAADPAQSSVEFDSGIDLLYRTLTRRVDAARSINVTSVVRLAHTERVVRPVAFLDLTACVRLSVAAPGERVAISD